VSSWNQAIDSFCVRCGYNKNLFITDVSKYQHENELEVYMKDNYQKVIYNKNLFVIFLLGPLYFSFFKFYLLGFGLFLIELILSYFINYIFLYTPIGFYAIIMYYLTSRILYVIFGNSLLLKLLKKKLSYIKRKDNYKEIISKYQVCSFASLLLSILFIIFALSMFLIWYRIQNGTLIL
jgi:hypothetical protein